MLIIVVTLILMVRIGGDLMEIREREIMLGNLEETDLKDGEYLKAPEFRGIEAWINSEPLTMDSLRGKVVLIDFWTYSCIHCIRTLPYLKAWHGKYSDNGLVLIGVHTPEFFFEEGYDNVKNAVEKYGLNYPVALDNDGVVWRSFSNRYWPTKYIIDGDGYIRFVHLGEGGYEEAEDVIRDLLVEGGHDLPQEDVADPSEAVDVPFWRIGTPEIYFGYAFVGNRNKLGNPEGFDPEGIVDYRRPKKVDGNLVYLHGRWLNRPDHMEYVGEEKDGRIILRYSARAVNIVAGSGSRGEIKISLDGEPLTERNEGRDAISGGESRAVIGDNGLYNIVFDEGYGEHTLELEVERGFKIYTFTFG
ncbi:MAG: redoxin domain-containing protein [Candidatus Hydrothermarchaeaceae archaeon]